MFLSLGEPLSDRSIYCHTVDQVPLCSIPRLYSPHRLEALPAWPVPLSVRPVNFPNHRRAFPLGLPSFQGFSPKARRSPQLFGIVSYFLSL